MVCWNWTSGTSQSSTTYANILMETHYGNEDYLQEVCKSINPNLSYNKKKTEEQTDECPSNEDGLMFPSYCSDGWLACDAIKNGCLWPNFIGFYCSGISFIKLWVLFASLVKSVENSWMKICKLSPDY